jgi:hypothetical protein
VFDLKCHVIWCTMYRYKILRGRVAERATRPDSTNLRGAGCGDSARIGVAGSHPSVAVVAASSVAIEIFCSTSRAGPAATCRRNFRSCENATGDNTCGRAGISARRWAQWNRQRSSLYREPEVGRRRSRVQDHRADGALSRLSAGHPSDGFSRTPATFSRRGFYRL